jgi:hypothetical protein
MVNLRMVRAAATAALVGIAVLVPASAATAAQPGISSVKFSGTEGQFAASPTITIRGAGFGAQPSGTNNDDTQCGPFPDNGEVFRNKLYFSDNGNFEAGYSTATGANCIGIKLVTWTTSKIVFTFGWAYNQSFDGRWYLMNGDGYAVSVKGAIWGGLVTGLAAG